MCEAGLHAAEDRELIALMGPWQVRRFAHHDPRYAYALRRGMMHVQLVAPDGTSLISPSALTGGAWEGQDLRGATVRCADAHTLVARLGTTARLPCPTCLGRLLDGWVRDPARYALLLGGVGVSGQAFPEA